MSSIAEVMTRSVVTVTPDTPIPIAEWIDARKHIHHLPVVDRGELIGIVCEHDLEQANQAGAVADCMTSPVFWVSPMESLESAVATMRERAIGCLPVVQSGRLLGIVTHADLLRAGIPVEEACGPTCASCGTNEHVRLDPRTSEVAFCVDCLERACPPRDFEDIGGGD